MNKHDGINAIVRTFQRFREVVFTIIRRSRGSGVTFHPDAGICCSPHAKLPFPRSLGKGQASFFPGGWKATGRASKR